MCVCVYVCVCVCELKLSFLFPFPFPSLFPLSFLSASFFLLLYSLRYSLQKQSSEKIYSFSVLILVLKKATHSIRFLFFPFYSFFITHTHTHTHLHIHTQSYSLFSLSLLCSALLSLSLSTFYLSSLSFFLTHPLTTPSLQHVDLVVLLPDNISQSWPSTFAVVVALSSVPTFLLGVCHCSSDHAWLPTQNPTSTIRH